MTEELTLRVILPDTHQGRRWLEVLNDPTVVAAIERLVAKDGSSCKFSAKLR